jgi:hypothetical protein
VVGYDSLLFVTKTNAGLDFDSKPPTAEVSIARRELIISPTYEGGQTPPALGSFRFDTSIFRTYLGSAFATGDAALAMAMLYGGESYSPVQEFDAAWWQEIDGQEKSDEDEATSKGMFNSGLELTQKPCEPAFLKKQKPCSVRPVVFGTDTGLGVKIVWSGATAQVPDSLKIGYSRKELAWAPVTMRPKSPDQSKDTDPHIAQAPSLLATVDAGVEVATADKTKLQFLQYFATGRAATALALQEEVRKAMLKRLDPEQEKHLKAKARPFNSDPRAIDLRERIDRWLLDATAAPTPPGGTLGELHERELKAWLKAELGIDDPISVWQITALCAQLEQAIGHFNIP